MAGLLINILMSIEKKQLKAQSLEKDANVYLTAGRINIDEAFH